MPTFDGINRVITLDSGITSVDAQVDLYSDWKEWSQLDQNGKFPPAFFTIGGEDLGNNQSVSPYFFLNNSDGWTIRPPEEDIEISIQGNLFALDPDIKLFTMTIGTFDTVITLVVSPQSITTAVNTGSGLDPTQDARLILMEKILRNKFITDPSTGIATVYDDDNTTPLIAGQLYEDAPATQTYRGQGAERRERLE